jgi:serpin B
MLGSILLPTAYGFIFCKEEITVPKIICIVLIIISTALTFEKSESKGNNTLISPLSVLCALSMTANGAKEETLEQMERVFGLPIDKLNQYIHNYLKNLPQSEKYKLSLANSIWFTDDDRFTVNDDFLQTNTDYYGANIFKAPFNEATKDDINNWVNEKTDEMISEILDDISPDAVMYLVNALAFKAEWMEIYKENQIREDKFTKEDGTEQNATFMNGSESIYLEDENATGFMKEYKDGKYAFVALLPNEGVSVSEYIGSINGETLNSLLENPKYTTVKTSIPKFETEYSVEMSAILSSMGMEDGFNPEKANFKGLGTSTAGNIYISRVLHKTFISVGEKGTRAGAATVVEMKDYGMMETDKPKQVYLDRPFVYMIVDRENNIPFFIGTMMDIEK